MGTVVIFAIAAAIAVLGWRGVKSEHKRVVTALKDAEAALSKRATAGTVTLEKDPQTGVYRPPKRS